MLKKIINSISLVLICIMFCINTTGCGSESDINNTNVIKSTMIKIGKGSFSGSTDKFSFYYDSNTKVVYIEDYQELSAYYADNGKPYLYNTETKELEEIE